MKKSTLTTLLGLLFVMPFSSCEAVPSGSESSLETLASSTSESSLEDSLSTGGTASSSSSSTITVSEPKGTPDKLIFTLNTTTKAYDVSLNEETCGYGSVVIPSTYNGVPVTRIADKGFRCERGPYAVYIPKSIMKIGDDAFTYSGTFLERIDVSPDNLYYSSCNGMLLNKDQTELIRCPKGKNNEIKLPNTVLNLRDRSFYGCDFKNFKGLPDSLIKIGNWVFEYVKNMPSKFVIPNNVTEIGKYSLSNASFSELILGNSLNYIGEYAFQNCENITRLEIPSSMRTINTCAFYRCRSLNDVVINPGLERIEQLAFSECTSLTRLIIPETVSYISGRAFARSSSIEWFQVSPQNPYYCSVDDVIYNKNQTVLVSCPPRKKAVTIPYTVTSIGDYAFSYNNRITSIVIPDRVTRVGHDAFYYCSSLQEVTIGKSVTLLDQYSFYECEALETVNIQSKVLEEIDNNSFHHCVSLAIIKIPDSVERIGGFAFQDCSSLQEVGLGSGVSRIDICAFADTDALECFYYAGSMSDWASISKGSQIFGGSSLTSISCSDGDVNVNA